MNLPQVASYLEAEDVPALDPAPSSLSWWAAQTIDPTRWMLRTELVRGKNGYQLQHADRTRRLRSRAVVYLGREYPSIVAAGKATGTHPSTILSRLKAERK